MRRDAPDVGEQRYHVGDQSEHATRAQNRGEYRANDLPLREGSQLVSERGPFRGVAVVGDRDQDQRRGEQGEHGDAYERGPPIDPLREERFEGNPEHCRQVHAELGAGHG